MIYLRASSVGRVIACPASVKAPELQIEGSDYMARLGTAGHSAGEMIVKGEDWQSSVLGIAEKNDVDADELRMIGMMLRSCWDSPSLKPNFPNPVTEHQFEFVDEENGITLSGRPDLYSIVGSQGRIPDWKTGYSVNDHSDQLQAYGFLLLKEFPELESFWGATVHVRQKEISEPISVTRGELDEWYAELVKTVQKDHFRPSHESCQYCPRRYGCPARKELLQDASGVLCGVPDDSPWMTKVGMGTIPDDVLRQTTIAAKHLKALCEAFLDTVKSEVLIRGSHDEGLDAVGIDGLQVRKQNRKTLNADAWEPLVQQLGMDRVKDCAKLSKTAIEKKIGEIAPKGMKGKLAKQTFEDLEKAGAMETSVVEILELRPIKAIITY